MGAAIDILELFHRPHLRTKNSATFRQNREYARISLGLKPCSFRLVFRYAKAEERESHLEISYERRSSSPLRLCA